MNPIYQQRINQNSVNDPEQIIQAVKEGKLDARQKCMELLQTMSGQDKMRMRFALPLLKKFLTGKGVSNQETSDIVNNIKQYI